MALKNFIELLHEILSWCCVGMSALLFGVVLSIIIADYQEEGRHAGSSVIPCVLLMIYLVINSVLLISNVI